ALVLAVFAGQERRPDAERVVRRRPAGRVHRICVRVGLVLGHGLFHPAAGHWARLLVLLRVHPALGLLVHVGVLRLLVLLAVLRRVGLGLLVVLPRPGRLVRPAVALRVRVRLLVHALVGRLRVILLLLVRVRVLLVLLVGPAPAGRRRVQQ